MLNFAEQTGSGAVIVVWSFLRAKSSQYDTIQLIINTGLTLVQPLYDYFYVLWLEYWCDGVINRIYHWSVLVIIHKWQLCGNSLWWFMWISVGNFLDSSHEYEGVNTRNDSCYYSIVLDELTHVSFISKKISTLKFVILYVGKLS